MSDRLTEKVIPENNEDGEELCCEQPHPTNSAHVNLPQLDILTVEKAQRVNFRKQGRHVFYRLQDLHVLSFYQAVVEHLDEMD